MEYNTYAQKFYHARYGPLMPGHQVSRNRNWDNKRIALNLNRGVGKTTLLENKLIHNSIEYSYLGRNMTSVYFTPFMTFSQLSDFRAKISDYLRNVFKQHVDIKIVDDDVAIIIQNTKYMVQYEIRFINTKKFISNCNVLYIDEVFLRYDPQYMNIPTIYGVGTSTDISDRELLLNNGFYVMNHKNQKGQIITIY